MTVYKEIQKKWREFNLPNKPLPTVVLILLIVLAIVAIALLPTILLLRWLLSQ